MQTDLTRFKTIVVTPSLRLSTKAALSVEIAENVVIKLIHDCGVSDKFVGTIQLSFMRYSKRTEAATFSVLSALTPATTDVSN